MNSNMIDMSVTSVGLWNNGPRDLSQKAQYMTKLIRNPILSTYFRLSSRPFSVASMNCKIISSYLSQFDSSIFQFLIQSTCQILAAKFTVLLTPCLARHSIQITQLLIVFEFTRTGTSVTCQRGVMRTNIK